MDTPQKITSQYQFFMAIFEGSDNLKLKFTILFCKFFYLFFCKLPKPEMTAKL